jgi:hypothetical protein
MITIRATMTTAAMIQTTMPLVWSGIADIRRKR